jgi:PAS domain-containing protein
MHDAIRMSSSEPAHLLRFSRRSLRDRTVTSAGAPQLIAVALVLCIGIYVLQAQDTNPSDSEEVLYVIPIALLALRFGLRGGVSGALVGLALIGLWDWHSQDFGLTVGGYLSWGIAFMLLGVSLGAFVDHRHRLEAEIVRYFDGSLDLLATVDLNGRFTRVNPAWERTLGHAAQTLCSRPFIEFVHPDDREATLAEIEHAAGSHFDPQVVAAFLLARNSGCTDTDSGEPSAPRQTARSVPPSRESSISATPVRQTTSVRGKAARSGST